MKTLQEMADEYNVHRSTFRRRLRNVGIDLPRGRISPKHQALIYEALGKPKSNTPRQRY